MLNAGSLVLRGSSHALIDKVSNDKFSVTSTQWFLLYPQRSKAFTAILETCKDCQPLLKPSANCCFLKKLQQLTTLVNEVRSRSATSGATEEKYTKVRDAYAKLREEHVSTLREVRLVIASVFCCSGIAPRAHLLKKSAWLLHSNWWQGSTCRLEK